VIYRKLGISTRSQAITRARELGLLEGWRPAAATLQIARRPGRAGRRRCAAAEL